MKTEKKKYSTPDMVVVTLPDELMGDGHLTIASTAEDKPGPMTVAPHNGAEEEDLNDNPWGN